MNGTFDETDRLDAVDDDDLTGDLGPDAVTPEAAVPSPRRFDADAIVDTLVPSSVDWRGTVRRHPVVSVMTVALVGYLVGRTKGAAILTGVTAGLSSALMRQLSDVFEGDFFEF